MKKIMIFFLTIVVTLCSSCGKTNEPKETIEPQEAQMRTICELATMECYYHNVAKYKEEDAEKFLFFWSKDKHFWIEYSGVVTVGIDVSKLTISVKDEKVTITMPPAKVLDCEVEPDSLSEKSIIVAKDSADIKAEDQTEAFAIAQAHMQETAKADTTLLANAQARAQKLLEDYVNNIGNSVGKQYEIEWNCEQ